MNSFGEMLQNYIEENEISISKFSNVTGIYRGGLYRIFRGEKKLTEKELEDMLKNYHFTEFQENSLREAYHQESYRHDVLQRILYIRDALNDMSKSSVIIKKLEEYTPEKSCENLYGQTGIVKAIEFMLRYELKKDKPFIFTNYPYKNKHIDNHVYTILSETDKPINYQHVVRFENNGISTNNLCNVFSCIRFAKLKYNTFYIYTNDLTENITDTLFPCCFITNSHVLLFNPSESLGFISDDSSLIETAKISAELVMQRSSPLAFYPENEMDFREALDTLQRNLICTFASNPCIGTLIDYNILNEAVHPYIPQRDMIIQAILHHYQQMEGLPHFDMIKKDGFTRFAKDGKCFEASDNLIGRVNIKFRKIVLQRQLEEITKSKKQYVNIFNDSRINFPENLDIELADDCVFFMLTLNCDTHEEYLGQLYLSITDNHIISDFKNFQKYLFENNYLMPEKFFKYYLKDLIIQCEKDDKQ